MVLLTDGGCCERVLDVVGGGCCCCLFPFLASLEASLEAEEEELCLADPLLPGCLLPPEEDSPSFPWLSFRSGGGSHFPLNTRRLETGDEEDVAGAAGVVGVVGSPPSATIKFL